MDKADSVRYIDFAEFEVVTAYSVVVGNKEYFGRRVLCDCELDPIVLDTEHLEVIIGLNMLVLDLLLIVGTVGIATGLRCRDLDTAEVVHMC